MSNQDNHTPQAETIDALLAKHDGYTLEEYRGRAGHNYSQNSYAVEFKAAISAMVAEIIGEDMYIDSEIMDLYGDGQVERLEAINKEKEFQRQRATAKGFTL